MATIRTWRLKRADHGADGIVGPYREKEGSFYTIKEIWSPIFIEKKYITPTWDGKLNIENRYDFSNTNTCQFSYSLSRFNSLDGSKDNLSGPVSAPDIAPGENGQLKLALPENWKEYDVLYLSIKDQQGAEIFKWSFELHSPAFFTERALSRISADPKGAQYSEDASFYNLTASGLTVRIAKESGMLKEVINKGERIPLSDGPVLVTERDVECKKVEAVRTDKGHRIDAIYQFKGGREAYRFSWTLGNNGVLQLDYSYRPQGNLEMAGVTFSFPEKDVSRARLLANGPYRVYNNRLKGGSLDVWNKKYNDAITGEVWEYPEFKGYYSLFYGMSLECPTPFEIYSASEDLSLHLFTPSIQRRYDRNRNYTFPNYPKGNISFMDAIPAVGTKFGRAQEMGPQSQLHSFKEYSGASDMKNRIYFRFNLTAG